MKENSSDKSNLTVVTLSDLEKLFGLVTAHAKLVQRNPKIHVTGTFCIFSKTNRSELSERDTIVRLTLEGFFDTAISLSILFDKSLKTVLETLTSKCLQYQFSPSLVANDFVEHDWFTGLELLHK